MKSFLLTLCGLLTLQVSAGVKSTAQDLTDRQDLLVNVLVRVQTEAALNQAATTLILSCLQGSKNPECPMIKATILDPFPQVVRDARLHLALGYRDSLLPQRMTTPNSRLWSLGTYKDVWWDALSNEEEKIAQIVLDRSHERAQNKAIKKFSPNDPRYDRLIKLAVRHDRQNHLNVYKGLLSQIVFLQYVKGSKITAADMKVALEKMLDRSQKELSMLSKAARAAELWTKSSRACVLEVKQSETMVGMMMADPSNPIPRCIQTPSALLRLLDYQGFVQGFVFENPQYQAVLKQLSEERQIRTISNLLTFGLPVIAVSFFAPPLVAIPAGGLAGGIGFLMAQNDYNQVRRRELSMVINAAGNVDWSALKEARLMKNVSLFMVPFFGAGSSINKAVKLSAPVSKMMSGMARLKSSVLRK
jgi:hypothetical protein